MLRKAPCIPSESRALHMLPKGHRFLKLKKMKFHSYNEYQISEIWPKSTFHFLRPLCSGQWYRKGNSAVALGCQNSFTWITFSERDTRLWLRSRSSSVIQHMLCMQKFHVRSLAPLVLLIVTASQHRQH